MKTVIQMAREAGFPFNKYGLLQGNDDNEIDADAMFERFAELVRADERENGQKWFDAVTAQHKQAILAEREACAKVCDDAFSSSHAGRVICNNLASAIRARSNT